MSRSTATATSLGEADRVMVENTVGKCAYGSLGTKTIPIRRRQLRRPDHDARAQPARTNDPMRPRILRATSSTAGSTARLTLHRLDARINLAWTLQSIVSRRRLRTPGVHSQGRVCMLATGSEKSNAYAMAGRLCRRRAHRRRHHASGVPQRCAHHRGALRPQGRSGAARAFASRRTRAIGCPGSLPHPRGSGAPQRAMRADRGATYASSGARPITCRPHYRLGDASRAPQRAHAWLRDNLVRFHERRAATTSTCRSR